MSNASIETEEPAEPNQILIQTNHGVTYPLVGLGRIKQQELLGSPTTSGSTQHTGRQHTGRWTMDRQTTMGRQARTVDTVKAIAS